MSGEAMEKSTVVRLVSVTRCDRIITRYGKFTLGPEGRMDNELTEREHKAIPAGQKGRRSVQ